MCLLPLGDYDDELYATHAIYIHWRLRLASVARNRLWQIRQGRRPGTPYSVQKRRRETSIRLTKQSIGFPLNLSSFQTTSRPGQHLHSFFLSLVCFYVFNLLSFLSPLHTPFTRCRVLRTSQECSVLFPAAGWQVWRTTCLGCLALLVS